MSITSPPHVYVNDFISEKDLCFICLENFDNESITKLDCCQQNLHTECLYKWLSHYDSKHTCPMCRKHKVIIPMQYIVEKHETPNTDVPCHLIALLVFSIIIVGILISVILSM